MPALSLCRQSALRVWLVLLFSLCLLATYLVGQNEPSATDPKHFHPAPGTSIHRFAEIDHDLYKGSKPRNDADYRFLQSRNIKTIVDIKFFPWLYRFESEKAKKYGMHVIPVTMNASPLAPSETHVRQILCLLADKRLRPIYFHCDVGRDRTSLIATLYEIHFRSLASEKAWHEMKHFGFKDDWTLHGLKSYLQKHATSSFTAADCNPDSGTR
jgi:hypothetical protein